MDYTFAQPVRGGYYYIVARADSKEEAVTKAEDAMKDIEYKQKLEEPFSTSHPEGLVHFGTHSEGTVVLKPAMEKRLNEFGVAHTFYRRELPPFSERMGYRSKLP